MAGPAVFCLLRFILVDWVERIVQMYLVYFVGDGWCGGLTCDFAGVFGD